MRYVSLFLITGVVVRKGLEFADASSRFNAFSTGMGFDLLTRCNIGTEMIYKSVYRFVKTSFRKDPVPI